MPFRCHTQALLEVPEDKTVARVESMARRCAGCPNMGSLVPLWQAAEKRGLKGEGPFFPYAYSLDGGLFSNLLGARGPSGIPRMMLVRTLVESRVRPATLQRRVFDVSTATAFGRPA